MCGIAGICKVDPHPAAHYAPLLRQMNQSMYHRGPDDDGQWVAPGGRCGLANRRLAIIDLSAAGHMPMSSDDRRYTITFNGEIYNFQSIRDDLRRAGFQFTSNTDTEVLLHAYRAWGPGCLDRLRGMFAFAIWDEHEQTLFAARDRLGIKPLYYCAAPDGVVFASELGAFYRGMPAVPPLEPQALVAFMRFGAVPPPLTMATGILALEPAHCLYWQPQRGLVTERYWNFPGDTEQADRPFDEAAAQVRHVLAEAVRLRLIADVPLGAFVSGGLDSSSVVALMRQFHPGTLRTCSITFAERAYNEGSWAKQISQAFETEHYQRELSAAEVWDELPRILRHIDQPSVDGINTYFVSKVAREQGLSIALSGLGGDELFAGYQNIFTGVPQLHRALNRLVPLRPLAEPAIRGVTRIPRFARYARLTDAISTSSFASAYHARRGLFSSSETQRVLSGDIWAQGGQLDVLGQIEARMGAHDTRDPFYETSRAELTNYTHHQLLRDTDVMSMAHSLEVRVPLLDHVLVETIHRLPAHYHRHDGSKPLLRAALGDLLPPAIQHRPLKQGFVLPFDVWLREELRPYVQDVLHTARVHHAEVFNTRQVDILWQRFERSQVHWMRLWAVIVLTQWLQTRPAQRSATGC